MKKRFMLAASLLALATAAQAQRMVLVEEFTGENCSPCADENPRLTSLLNNNAGKALLLRYQSPIPNAGPIHNQYPTGVMTRLNYYSAYFAPWGEVDGREVGSGQYPAYVADIDQASINAAYALPSPFAILLTSVYNAAKDSLITTIKITATSAYTGAGLKLRLALAETLHFTTAPGDNGERHFEHVVRMLYPDATGTTLPDSWTAGQSQTLTIRGQVPSYVNNSNDILMAAWVQNDATRAVLQAQRADIGNTTRVSPQSELDQAVISPNPASQSAVVRLDLQQPRHLGLRVSDCMGRVVYKLPEQQHEAGPFALTIPVEGFAPGIYYVQVTAGDEGKTFRLTVARP